MAPDARAPLPAYFEDQIVLRLTRACFWISVGAVLAYHFQPLTLETVVAGVVLIPLGRLTVLVRREIAGASRTADIVAPAATLRRIPDGWVRVLVRGEVVHLDPETGAGYVVRGSQTIHTGSEWATSLVAEAVRIHRRTQGKAPPRS